MHRSNIILPSEITPQVIYEDRRNWLKLMAGGAAGVALAGWAGREALAQGGGKLAKLAGVKSSVPGAITMDKVTEYKDATTYNNYYEFGTDKADPARTAGSLRTRPWTVSVEGEVGKPGTFDLDSLLKLSPMEDRVYRLRCVEGLSLIHI